MIKVCATGGVLSFEETVGAPQFTEAEMRAIGEETALVAVPGNPLADITVTERPAFVMKGGEVVAQR